MFSSHTKSSTLQNLSTKNLVMPSYDSHSSLSPVRNAGNKSLNEMKFKTQIIIVKCSKHSEELLKFIDSNSNGFEPQCDCCIVDPQNSIAKMKLERVIDLQDRIRMQLMTNIHQLRDLGVRVEEITREINVTNALRNPIMSLIDYMENKINKETEYVFKRLRERFTVLNPLEEVHRAVREKIEIEKNKVRMLDSQGLEALMTLRELLKEESKMKEDLSLFKANVNKKLEDAKKYDPVMDKDFGFVQNAFEEFVDATKKICEKFMLSFKK